MDTETTTAPRAADLPRGKRARRPAVPPASASADKLGADGAVVVLRGWPGRLGVNLAAAYLGVSRNTLLRGVKSGRYPPPVRDGRRVLWHLTALDRWLARQADGAADCDDPFEKALR